MLAYARRAAPRSTRSSSCDRLHFLDLPIFGSEDSSQLYYGLLAGKMTDAGLLAARASVLQTLAFIRFAAA